MVRSRAHNHKFIVCIIVPIILCHVIKVYIGRTQFVWGTLSCVMCPRAHQNFGLHVRAVPISYLQAYTCIYRVHLTLVSINILNLAQYSLHAFKFGDLYACTNWLVQTSRINIEVSSILWKPYACRVDFHDHLFRIIIIFRIVITNNNIIMRTVLPAHVCIRLCIDHTF